MHVPATMALIHKSLPTLAATTIYCKTGAHVYTCCRNPNRYHFYLNNILWDGQLCVAEEAPCCTHTNMLWFVKTLSETTTEDIELRACADQMVTNEDIPLQVIDLFVH